MMMVGDDDHCADAVVGSAKTATANNAGKTLVIFMKIKLQRHRSPMISSWCGRSAARKLTD
jgi:hypothetical protein